MKNLLIDLDGTISNPQEGIIDSIKYAIRKTNIKINPSLDFTQFIGPPLISSLRVLCETEDVAQKALGYFRQAYSKKGIYQNSMYDGMSTGLRSIKNEGCKIFVVTNKPLPYAVRVLSFFDILSLFAGVYGPGLNEDIKKGDLIEDLLVERNILANEGVMVGDRDTDIIAAKKHEIQTIGVLYGFGSRQELTNAGADHLANNTKHLFELIRSL